MAHNINILHDDSIEDPITIRNLLSTISLPQVLYCSTYSGTICTKTIFKIADEHLFYGVFLFCIVIDIY